MCLDYSNYCVKHASVLQHAKTQWKQIPLTTFTWFLLDGVTVLNQRATTVTQIRCLVPYWRHSYVTSAQIHPRYNQPHPAALLSLSQAKMVASRPTQSSQTSAIVINQHNNQLSLAVSIMDLTRCSKLNQRCSKWNQGCSKWI